MAEVDIIPFQPELAADFARLNRTWIETHFQIEPADEEVLQAPERIVEAGGAILFARRIDGTVVGTAALLPLGAGIFEIAKMAVDEAMRGQGIGDQLMRAVIDEAKRRGAQRLKIETNSRLEPALRLYRRHGFVPDDKAASAHGFARADVFLERILA